MTAGVGCGRALPPPPRQRAQSASVDVAAARQLATHSGAAAGAPVGEPRGLRTFRSCSREEIAQAADAFFQLALVNRVCESDVFTGAINAEVDARRQSNTRA